MACLGTGFNAFVCWCIGVLKEERKKERKKQRNKETKNQRKKLGEN